MAEFEQAFASFTGVHHCVGVASGLDALRLALLATEIEPGDEVIVPANKFPATVEAITQARGVPLLVDASESDYNIDPAAAASAVTSRTRILLPVHLYGQLGRTACSPAVSPSRYGLVVIEDACQAHGADRDGISPGTHTGAAAFSFYPAKNLGAMGDAGAIVTNSTDVAEVVGALREHGQRAKYEHEREGWTARLDTIQAIVLLHKLPLMNAWTGGARPAAWYLKQLRAIGEVTLPAVPTGSEPVWHLSVIRTAHVEELAAYLEGRGVATVSLPQTDPSDGGIPTPGEWIGRVSGLGASCS